MLNKYGAKDQLANNLNYSSLFMVVYVNLISYF